MRTNDLGRLGELAEEAETMISNLQNAARMAQSFLQGKDTPARLVLFQALSVDATSALIKFELEKLRPFERYLVVEFLKALDEAAKEPVRRPDDPNPDDHDGDDRNDLPF